MEQRDLTYIIEAHTNHPRKQSKAFRKWDGKTPYYIHPVWCATMILTETTLPENTRQEGAQALLYHDLLEDTDKPLPDWLSDRVKGIIQDMTFPGGSAQEMQEIWTKPQVVRLYKLYDKISNLLDAYWMSEAKLAEYKVYTSKLRQDVLERYGSLNITKIMMG
jgi:hypothetical protein